MTKPLVYRIGAVEVLPSARQVRVDGQDVTVGARAFDLLLVLIEHRQRMLTKSELLDRVWPGVVVEENNLQVQVSALRKLLGTQAIATIPGRGYRFTAAIEDQAPAPQPPAAPAPEASDAGNLGADGAPLLGREPERAELVRLLQQPQRLVTVVGAGGIGKTRLATAVARQVASNFSDGGWLVELVALAAATDLVGHVAQVLRIALPGREPRLAELCDRLHGQQLLLVVDNCEHLADAVAALVRAMLDAVPGLRVLATSQEPLRLADEQVMRLGSLAVPLPGTAAEQARQAGAVALFVARAAAVQGRFEVDERNLDAVVDICRQLDGLPLAIELAASRVPLLGVDGVRRHLAERFELLAGTRRDAPSRHRTLRAALDWSHALLGADEQKVFRRLGVMVGGFGLELAALVVADDEIPEWNLRDHLGLLIDRSLVVAEAGERPRYRLLESARAYALEQLRERSELDAMRLRHARGLLRAMTANWRSPQAERISRSEWTLIFAAEVDNLRAALEWAGTPGRDPALALELHIASASLMYQIGRYHECLQWMMAGRALLGDDTPALVRARFLFGMAIVGLYGLPARERLPLLFEVVPVFERSDRQSGVIAARCAIAYAQTSLGQHAEAKRELDACRALFETAPRLDWLRVIWLFTQATLHLAQGRAEPALDCIGQALSIAHRVGDRRSIDFLISNQGLALHVAGRLDEAERCWLDFLDPATKHVTLTVDVTQCFVNLHLVRLHVERGRLDEAAARLRAAMRMVRRAVGIGQFTATLAYLAARQGRLRDAALLLGYDEALHEQHGEPPVWIDQRVQQAVRELVLQRHGAAELDAWRAEGATIDEDKAEALALAI